MHRSCTSFPFQFALKKKSKSIPSLSKSEKGRIKYEIVKQVHYFLTKIAWSKDYVFWTHTVGFSRQHLAHVFWIRIRRTICACALFTDEGLTSYLQMYSTAVLCVVQVGYGLGVKTVLVSGCFGALWRWPEGNSSKRELGVSGPEFLALFLTLEV